MSFRFVLSRVCVFLYSLGPRALLRLERTMNLLEGGKGGEGRMGERGWGGDGGRVGREGGEGTWGREGG